MQAARSLATRSARRLMSTYSEKMDATGRPISPHITIYAWPTIAISSVMMRATGMMLSIGAPAPLCVVHPWRLPVRHAAPLPKRHSSSSAFGALCADTVASPWLNLRVRDSRRCAPGTAGIAFMALPSATMPQDFAQYMASSSLAAPTKFAVGFPLVYHWFGAIRHAVWDLKAWGFSNQAMLQSSYALAGASVVVSLGLAAYSMPVDKPKKKM